MGEAGGTYFLLPSPGLETQVGVVEGFLCRDSLGGAGLEHAGEQVERLGVHLLVDMSSQAEFHVFIVVVDLVVFGPLEERLAGQQEVQDDPSRENITGGLNVLTLGKRYDLRRHVSRSTTAEEQVLMQVSIGGQPEVSDNWLEAVLASQHDIFGFQVTVHDPSPVERSQPVQNAAHEFLGAFGGKMPSVFLNSVQQVSPRK